MKWKTRDTDIAMLNLQKTSSWADEAENDTGIQDLPAPPPSSNPWKKNAPVEPAKLVFEDFEV